MSWVHDFSRESTPAVLRPQDASTRRTRRGLVGRLEDALRARRLPTSWVALSGYLGAGVFLGLLLILALALSGRDKAAAASLTSAAHEAATLTTTFVPTSTTSVTDNVVRIGPREIGDSCWRGMPTSTARVDVRVEVDTDGHVRAATAKGSSPTLRGCVEAHVKAWSLLPQAQPQVMVLPFEVSRR